VVIGVVAVILAVVAVVYYLDARESAAEEAGSKFAQALMDYRSGNNQVAVLSFAQLVEDYSDQPAAEYSTYLLGISNYRQRNYDEAIRYYQEYLSRFKGDLLMRAGAMAGMAACFEDQGRLPEAMEKYEQAISEYPSGPQIGDYHLGAMRCAAGAGNTEKAREHLAFIQQEYKGTQLVESATRLAAEGGIY